MPFDLQEYPEVWPAHLDVYERAFLATVLRLAGAGRAPTELQRARAMKVLQLYRRRTALLKSRRSAMHSAALQGRLAQAAAAEQAFVFVRFDSVLPADAAQLVAFNEWTGLLERDGVRQEEDPELLDHSGNAFSPNLPH